MVASRSAVETMKDTTGKFTALPDADRRHTMTQVRENAAERANIEAVRMTGESRSEAYRRAVRVLCGHPDETNTRET